MNKYVLYVGANNVTKLVDYTTLHKVVGEWFKGYTVQDAQGVWGGAQEKAAIVTIFSSLTLGKDATDGSVLLLASELCTKLDQYCILVEIDGKGVMVENKAK